MPLHKFCLTALLILSLGASAQTLTVRFDLSHARQTLALLGTDSFKRTDLPGYFAHPGTRALIRKVRSTPDTALHALLGARAGHPPTAGDRAFRFTGIYKYRDTLRRFLEALERQAPALSDSVSKALAPYAPTGRSTQVTVYGLLGGPSMGFTLGDDTAFYLGLQFYNFDVAALVESCKHELLHNLQAARFNSTPIALALERRDAGAAQAYMLLAHLFREGSAEWLADLRRLERTPKVRELVEHAEVNDGRTADAFHLVERLLLDLYRHPDDGRYDRSYNILFDWSWNNPGYYVGYRMMKALEAAKGPGVLHRYIASDPTVFVQDYLQLAASQQPVPFSTGFAKLVAELHRKAIKEKDRLAQSK